MLLYNIREFFKYYGKVEFECQYNQWKKMYWSVTIILLLLFELYVFNLKNRDTRSNLAKEANISMKEILLIVNFIILLTNIQFVYCRYQGYISAALVLGGVDSTGPHLYSVYPHGSTDSLPYVTMGKSGLYVI